MKALTNLINRVNVLGYCVVVPITNTTDRGIEPCLHQSLGVTDGKIETAKHLLQVVGALVRSDRRV